jgi:transcriptional regulator with XRE-family HTH domain
MKTLGLGQRIRELREERDLSLRELAKTLDVSAAFLSDIELGRRYPSEKVLAKIAHALGTSVEDLRSYDTRLPVKDLKRLTNSDTRYGFAFRQVIDKKISPEKLIELAEKESKRHKK